MNSNRPGSTLERRIPIALFLVLSALVVIMNLLATTATDRFSLTFDMTDSGLYELSQTTMEVTGLLTEPVTITVFSDEADYTPMIRELLSRYRAASSLLNVRYRDPFSDPLLVDTYEQQGFTINQYDLIIEGSQRIRQLRIDDLFSFNSAKTEVTGLRAEQQLTGALLYVNDDSVSRIIFTDGHNERPSQSLIELFTGSNYEVQRSAIGITGLDQMTDAVVIADPSRDFSEQEISQLEQYLSGGGNVMVFSGPSAVRLTRLERLLESWGIILGNESIYEPDAHISDNPGAIVPMYARHPVNTFFGDNRYFLIMPSSRSLYRTEQVSFDITVLGLLTSTPYAYGKASPERTTTEQEADDPSGSFFLALSADKAGDGGSLIVIGSSAVSADDLLGMSSYANADFILQSAAWMTENEQTVRIPEKRISPPHLAILTREALIIGSFITLVLPISLLAAGFIITSRRRRA
ncbi:MAG: GldG family protein [Spirochaetia bacterium]|nr:GldG family protein [Spirochaetia bacterium]